MSSNLKAETLEAVRGNQLTLDNRWLAAHIEAQTKLHFRMKRGDGISGVLIAMGVYNYLVLVPGDLTASKPAETLISKAQVATVCAAS